MNTARRDHVPEMKNLIVDMARVPCYTRGVGSVDLGESHSWRV